MQYRSFADSFPYLSEQFARYLASQISTEFQGPSAHKSLHRSTSSSSSSGSSSSDEILEDVSSPTSQRQALRPPGGSSADLDSAASTWFSPREGDSAFDDYDDEEEEHAGSSAGKAFGNKNSWHGDFDIGINPPQSLTRKIHDSTAGLQHARQDRFGFDAAQFGSVDSDDDEEEEDDDGFGPFSDSYAAEPSPGAAMATVKGYTFDDDFATGSRVQSTAVREKLTRK